MASKHKDGKLIILDHAKSADHKTKTLVKQFAKLGVISALIIDGANLDPNFTKASRNIPHIDVLPEQGANVYDILRRDTLVLTRDAVAAIEARFAPEQKEAA